MIKDWILNFILDNSLIMVASLFVLVAVIRLMWVMLSPQDPNAQGGFIKRNWRNALIFVLVMTVCFSGYELYHTKKELANLETDKQTLIESNARLEQSISNVNTMIGKFDDFTKDTKKQFGALNKDVAKSNSALASQLAGIMKDKKPKTCEEALGYLIEANKEYAK